MFIWPTFKYWEPESKLNKFNYPQIHLPSFHCDLIKIIIRMRNRKLRIGKRDLLKIWNWTHLTSNACFKWCSPTFYYHKWIPCFQKYISKWLPTKLINSFTKCVRLYFYLDFVRLVSAFMMYSITFLWA